MLVLGEQLSEKDRDCIPEPVIEIFDRVVKQVQTRDKVARYPTGIHALDELTFGFHEGQVCTIAARPGDGKSAMMLQCAWNLAKMGIKTAIISLEMTKEELTERLFCHEMQVDNQILRRGNVEKVEKELFDFSKTLVKMPLYMTDAVGFSIEEIEKIITACQDVKVVFLDYLQLIRSGSDKKRNYEIGQYLRDFRSLSRKKKFCLIVLAQIHRASQERMNKRPMLHDLKDSGDIEQDSDTVLMLYWNANNEKETDANKYEVIVGKQRHGQIGTAKIKFKPQYYTFSSF